MRETVAELATLRKDFRSQSGGLLANTAALYVAGMATRHQKTKRGPDKRKKAARQDAPVAEIHGGKIPRLYMAEHLEARRIDVPDLAEQLGMHEKAVYKALKPANRSRIWKDIKHWAAAMGVEDWQDLTRPPNKPSVDARFDTLPEEFQRVILRAVGKG